MGKRSAWDTSHALLRVKKGSGYAFRVASFAGCGNSGLCPLYEAFFEVLSV